MEKKFKCKANRTMLNYIKYFISSNRKSANYLGAIESNLANSCLKEKSFIDLNLDKMCKSIKMLRDCKNFEYEDEKFAIENFINLIADEKLNIKSLNYKKICSQIRLFLETDKIKFIPEKGEKLSITLKEKDVNITKMEYQHYRKFKDNEEIIRAILGIISDKDETSCPVNINFNYNKNFNNNPNHHNNHDFKNEKPNEILNPTYINNFPNASNDSKVNNSLFNNFIYNKSSEPLDFLDQINKPLNFTEHVPDNYFYLGLDTISKNEAQNRDDEKFFKNSFIKLEEKVNYMTKLLQYHINSNNNNVYYNSNLQNNLSNLQLLNNFNNFSGLTNYGGFDNKSQNSLFNSLDYDILFKLANGLNN
jgi:hypothetical protein